MTDDREVRDYFAALEDALRDVRRDGRAEVLRDVRGHVEEARADEPDVPVRAVLDRLGPPAAVAAAARERYGTVPRRAYGWDVAAVLLLLLGFFVLPVVGWLAGVVLLWTGPRWTVGDKLLGTLVWPFGLALTFPGGALVAGTLVPGSALPDAGGRTALAALLVTAPLLVAVHLLRRAHRAA